MLLRPLPYPNADRLLEVWSDSIWRSARLAALGGVVGLGASLWLTRWLDSLLFNTTPRDPTVFAGVTLSLAALVLIASLVPALGASRVDPANVLRAE